MAEYDENEEEPRNPNEGNPIVHIHEPEAASEDDEVVAFCVDCCTPQPDSHAYKDKFLQAGKSGVCRYCKGPTVVTYASNIEGLKRRRSDGQIIQ